MSEVPLEVVVGVFKDEMAADLALHQLKQLQREKTIKIVDVAVLRRDERSYLHIKEPSDWGWRRGAVAGGVVGAVVGLLAGPVGWAALGGAAIGGLAAELRDSGFNNSELRRMGQALVPNSSAIVALLELDWVKPVVDELTNASAAIFTQRISAEIVESLEPEKDLGNTRFSAEAASGTDRTASAAGGKPVQAATRPEQPVGASQPPPQGSG